MVVGFHYTLTDDEAEVLDSSDDEPMEYLHGANNIVEGLEEALTGRRVGDSFQIAVPPEKGYGVRDEEAWIKVARDAFPEDAELEEGAEFVLEDEDGDPMSVWVAEVAPNHVILDRNHPLASVPLHFDVRVVSMRPASNEELEHGHPHGEHGHDH